MTHSMQLAPAPFRMVRAGAKTIELRLYDEKRRKLHIGDKIVFTCTEAPFETVEAEVLDLYVFDSFAALYRTLPLLECGYTEADIANAAPEDMDLYYSKDDQNRFGVVGIQIALL